MTQDSSTATPNGWVPDGRGVLPSGDVGGDIQAGDSYDVRFRHPDLPRAVITVWVYPVVLGDDITAPPFKVQVQAEYTICDDPERPGDTEEWADADYTALEPEFASLAAAQHEALTVAREFADGRRVPARNWDGEYFR